MTTQRPFRFALQAVPDEDRAAWHDLARQAEDVGFSTLQTPDHLGLPDPFTPLVSAADVTTTLRVGTLVINNELHNPVLLARQAATVDLLTDGRLELGLGTGYALDEHEAMAIPLSPPGERVRRLGAAVTIAEAPPRRRSSRTTTSTACTPRRWASPTVQRPHPPILVGGHGRRVLAMAAREAQIVQLTGLSTPPTAPSRPAGSRRRRSRSG